MPILMNVCTVPDQGAAENMNTVKSWNKRNYNENEKEATVAVHQVSKTKKLNGRYYKKLLRSLAKKAKGSDLSIQRKDKLFQSEVHVTGPNRSDEDETTNIHSSSAHSQHKRVDFLLRRVRYSDHAERSNSSNHATKTKLQGNQCNLYMSKLKEKSVHSIANECKCTTANFVEYWVPVRLSNVQIEQYCGSLFSNAKLLCSSLKHESTEILHDILVSARKCCDHPYLVERSLRNSLIQGIPAPEQLDAEIKLSTKLLLLHKIVLEIKRRGLRVLILYQSLWGSGPISTGDILDDIIHEKFGKDSFVRISEGISRSKRRAALKTFNDKGSGRFVCLMETRACLPSIKLASIDTVIFLQQ
ncbi:Helicase protein MOM1 [Sesamum alatum]|uniref:Helicase protein MOM1 n=1 Tax=Sesamum alatum TaxID=300844 RepID=A0AAE2CEH1_9LAMI|nr:Helicase protein MOM1 [Sesamum alatum]